MNAMKPCLSDPALYENDPYPVYRWLRRHAPVYRDDNTGMWALSRHADVDYASSHPEIFCSGEGVIVGNAAMISILTMDAPRHVRQRKLVSRGFTPRMIQRLEANMRDLARELIDAVARRGECDLVTDIAVPFPIRIIADMLGIPARDHAQFWAWTDDLIAVAGTELDEQVLVKATAAYETYANYLRGIFEERRRHPRGDLASVLVAAQQDGLLSEDEECLENDELVMFMTLLLVAGNETTRNAVSAGMLALMEHPEQRELLRRHPALMDSAVEEILRYVTPVITFHRTVVRDTVLHDVILREGERVMLLYQSANRDEAVFRDPERFDIARDPNPHLAFGVGAHYCLGANLARLEIKIMIEEILRRLPDMRPVPGTTPVRSAATILRTVHLPVEFTPAS